MATDYRSDPVYQRLNSAYRAAFGAGNFGDFDYDAFMSDPKYSGNIYDTIMAEPSGRTSNVGLKAKALDDLLRYFEQQQNGSGFEPMDLRGLFDPLREKIGQAGEEAKSRVASDINRSARGSTERATEALAGTGLGRSGVAAQTFTGIQEQRQDLMAKAQGQIDQAVMAQELETYRKEAELEYQEKLMERNWDLKQIEDALQFDRQLMLMAFQADAQYTEESWWDSWGSVLGTVAGIGLMFVPGGQVAGAGLVAGSNVSAGGGSSQVPQSGQNVQPAYP